MYYTRGKSQDIYIRASEVIGTFSDSSKINKVLTVLSIKVYLIFLFFLKDVFLNRYITECI